MRIERLEVKGFGRLEGLTLNLQKGLNIIFGNNEAGKTTLQWFIKGMLYGLKGAGQPRTGQMQPRKRFSPWDGGQFGGAMVYTLDDGSIYRVERDFERDTVRLFDAHFNDITNLFDKGRDKQPAFAERQLGLDEATLDRTVFIRQFEVRLDEDSSAALASRLANAGDTGFDDVSFGRAEKALTDALKNNVGTGRTTTQPLDKLEARLQQLNAMHEKLLLQKKQRETIQEELAAIRGIRGRMDAGRRYLEHIGDLIELRKALDYKLKQEAGLKEAVKQLKDAEESLDRAASATAGGVVPCTGVAFNSTGAVAGKSDSAVCGSGAEAGRTNTSDSCNVPQVRKQNHNHSWSLYASLVLMLLFVSMLVYSGLKGLIFSFLPFTLLSSAGALITGIAAILAFRRERHVQPLAEDEPGNATCINGPSAKGADFALGAGFAYEIRDRIKNICSSASLLCGKQMNDPKAVRQELQETAAILDKLSKRLDAGIEEAAGLGSNVSLDGPDDRAGLAKSFFKPDMLDTVLYDSSLENLEEAWKKELEDINRSFLDTALREKYLEGLLEDGKADSDELQRVEEETVAVREKIEYLKHKGDALKLAHEVLVEAGLEIRRSMAPGLDRSMSSVISGLTSGKYAALKGDDKLRLNMAVPETGDIKNARVFSGATADQAYLALRLALAGILTADGESLPLVMDEVFSQFDDNRTALALKYLQNTYEKGQVLIFTCKRREVELAREICGSNLNLVEL